MIEFLRHALGLCGEPHPSLLTLLMGTPILGYLMVKIKKQIKQHKKVLNERIRTNN